MAIVFVISREETKCQRKRELNYQPANKPLFCDRKIFGNKQKFKTDALKKVSHFQIPIAFPILKPENTAPGLGLHIIQHIGGTISRRNSHGLVSAKTPTTVATYNLFH